MKNCIIKLVKKVFAKRLNEEDVTLKEAVAIAKDPASVKDGVYYVVGTDAALGVRTFYTRVGWFTYTVEHKIRMSDGETKYDPKLLALIYADKRIDLKDELKLANVEKILAENAKLAKVELAKQNAEKAENARIRAELNARLEAERKAKIEAEVQAEVEKFKKELYVQIAKKYKTA